MTPNPHIYLLFFLIYFSNPLPISEQPNYEEYGYLHPSIKENCSIDVKYTPKEHQEMRKKGEHMMSIAREIPEGYYNSAIGLSSENLKSELESIITKKYKEYSYTHVWDFCKEADLNPHNSSEVWEIYMERGWDKEQTYGKDHIYKGWNREHMWAKSHGDFGTTMGAGTDFNHLRPADSRQNSFRNNMNYCYVDGPRTRADGCYEPPLSAKGDAARAIFYMATRWFTEYGLYIDNDRQVSKAGRIAMLDDLLQWHDLDPVDAYEINRQNKVYQWQNNRNPYIDHPELVDYIWGSKKGQPWGGGVAFHTDCQKPTYI